MAWLENEDSLCWKPGADPQARVAKRKLLPESSFTMELERPWAISGNLLASCSESDTMLPSTRASKNG